MNKKTNSQKPDGQTFNYQSFDYYALLFFTISFVGWLWEVILFYFTEHTFINRGIYKGPYLPIYGVGGLILCLFLHSYRKKPLRVFLLSLITCSVLEYLTSYFLELQWGIRWWDYSGHFLNISGRICLLGAVVFGLGGTALVCLFLPIYQKIYDKLSQKWRLSVMIVLLLIFAADAAYCTMRPNTGYGITTSLKYSTYPPPDLCVPVYIIKNTQFLFHKFQLYNLPA